MLGADGALIGSRLWASEEAPCIPHSRRAPMDEDNSTIRTTVVDIVRALDWPKPFTARVVKNGFVAHEREAELAERCVRDREIGRYVAAMQNGDDENTGVWVGEAAGLIRDVKPAGEIVTQMVAEAERLLRKRSSIALDYRASKIAV